MCDFTGLRKFRIESGIGDDSEPNQSNSSPSLVSTVEELIAFRRMPGLTVTIV